MALGAILRRRAGGSCELRARAQRRGGGVKLALGVETHKLSEKSILTVAAWSRTGKEVDVSAEWSRGVFLPFPFGWSESVWESQKDTTWKVVLDWLETCERKASDALPCSLMSCSDPCFQPLRDLAALTLLIFHCLHNDRCIGIGIGIGIRTSPSLPYIACTS